MRYKGFTLDRFQIDSAHAIDNNFSVVVSAPTGSGKTLIADYIIDKYLKQGRKIVYTAPIKALSNQKYKQFSREYGEHNVGILTGDIVINPTAPVLIMTTEIYRNMVIIKDPSIKEVSYVIFDEIHYINDRERGYVWEESVIFAPRKTRFLCLSATIPNAEEFAEWIQAIKKHKVTTVRHEKRNVPLHQKFFDTELGECTLKDIKEVAEIPQYDPRKRKRFRRRRIPPPKHTELVGRIRSKLPGIYFVFSRKNCQIKAKELSDKNFFDKDPEISRYVQSKLKDNPDIATLTTARLLRETLPKRIAFHHAGLLPILKEMVEHLFEEGKIKVLYATETFAVGINMPAKTVCFDGVMKYDGIRVRMLNTKEYFQIAGRAGRRGIDKEGFVYTMIDRRDYDFQKLKKLTYKDLDPIVSQFRLSVNTVLNLTAMHTKTEIQRILKQSFHSFQKYGAEFNSKQNQESMRTFRNLSKKLTKLGYVANGVLTEKGVFASKIFSEEILTAEIFATDFTKDMDLYQILMLIAAIAYEPSDKDRFKKANMPKQMRQLKKRIRGHAYLSKQGFFRYLNKLNGLIFPLYDGADFFELLEQSSMAEGDLMRFFRQMIDRVGQIRKATYSADLARKMDDCKGLIEHCMQSIEII